MKYQTTREIASTTIGQVIAGHSRVTPRLIRSIERACPFSVNSPQRKLWEREVERQIRALEPYKQRYIDPNQMDLFPWGWSYERT